ncbi:AAA family ATPase [Kitasatospora kazusensis]|uniref:AAA family ATPase n=1 Tax=Kitasatospora kazusensis TaxID=407974 RepID=A0ABP5LKJ8_9ACTN
MSTSEPSDKVRAEFADRLRRELSRKAAPAAEVGDARREYRKAACLLTQFDPVCLRRPGETEPSGGAMLALVDDCTSAGRLGDRDLWTLKAEVRETALRELGGPEEARAALERNLGEDLVTGPERAALLYLSGRPPDLDAQDVPELAEILQALLWLNEVPGMTRLPRVEDLWKVLEWARLMRPLESLLKDPFVGRERELARLYGFVGVPPASAQTWLRYAAERVRTYGHVPQEPPLVVHGPGGIGKSTLIARFLLDVVQHRRVRLPFAYVDFARPTISIHEPVTLLAEAARQLGIEYPALRGELDEVARDCELTAHLQRAAEDRAIELGGLSSTRGTLGRSSSREFQLRAASDESTLVRRLARLVLRAVDTPEGEAAPTLLIVVDSFEAAQYRGSPVLGRLWTIFDTLQAEYPRVRVVASGRAPIDHPAASAPPRAIELTGLEPRAATALLMLNGVRDPATARMLVRRVGGHPLSLKLAARAVVLAEQEGEPPRRTLRSLPGRRWQLLNGRVDQMLVQGVLYDRILAYIPDPDTRKLAHPGLVLRRITPDIIKNVLAEPCGVEVATIDRARALFDELARLDLVERAGPEAVCIRPDIRAIMLRLVENDRSALVRDIEERAVSYYAAREGLEARAEEIYHRLRLQQSLRLVEERWLPGVERFLEGAEGDLAPKAVAFLTVRQGGQPSDDVLADAEQEDWERLTAREVEDLLSQGFTEEAAARLEQRRPWAPCSPLHPLLVETLAGQGLREEARATVTEAIDRATEARCRGERLLELLRQSAELAMADGDLAGADEDLRQAQLLATSLGLELEALGVLLARAGIADRPGARQPGIEGELVARLRGLSDPELRNQPTLARAAAAEVAERDPQALDRVLRAVGLPGDTDQVLRPIETAIGRAATRRPELLGSLATLAASLGGFATPGADATLATVMDLLRSARRPVLDQFARRLLEFGDESGELVSGVAEAIGTDSPAKPAEGNRPDRPDEP